MSALRITVPFSLLRPGEDVEDIDLVLVADYTPEVPARRSGHPDTHEPGEPEEIEIVQIRHGVAGWTGELTKDETAEAHDKIRDAVAEQDDGADPDDSVDEDYDAMGAS